MKKGKRRLAALQVDLELTSVAKYKSQGYGGQWIFIPTSPHSITFDMLKSFGIRYTADGENIAKNDFCCKDSCLL
jgi:uncharacterized protein YkwD